MEKFKLTYDRVFSKTHFSSHDLYIRFLDKEYDENCGWGFSALSLNGTLISGSYLQKIKRYYQVWNAENECLDKMSYLIVKEIKFFLDIEKSYIIVQGGIGDMNSLKTAFRQFLWGEFTYEAITLDVFSFLLGLLNDKMLVGIEEVCFSDVVIQDRFVGKYIATPTALTNDIDSLKLIKGILEKTKVRISIENYIYGVSISSNNTYMLNGTDDCVIAFINYLISKTC